TYASAEAIWRNPITGMADCCARTENGHAAAALLRSVMNSRRLTAAPEAWTTDRSNFYAVSERGDVRFGPIADITTSPSYWFAFFDLRFGLSEPPSAPFTPPVTPPTVPPTTVPTAPPTGPAALLPSRAPWLAPCCAPPTTPCALAMTGTATAPRIPTRINVAFICILQLKNKEAYRVS